MNYNSHIVFLPGDVSIDFIEAVRRAINKIRPVAGPSSRFGNTGNNLIGQAKDKLDNLKRKGLVSSPILYPPIPGQPIVYETASDKAARIRRELLDAGITWYGLLKSESRILYKLLHPLEHVEAIVYGQHRNSSVMLVATNERIIFLDKKPMALFLDEVSYEVVSGIEFEIHTLFATLILHTPVKNYDIRYANLRCAERFARHIEAERLKREEKTQEAEAIIAEPGRLKLPSEVNHPNAPREDMAGYYWLPNEEEERERFIQGEAV